ncbi:MAG: type I asparaginase [Bacteroidales bacterium]|nr:type I asparaginase [Bacteroidales bacterium]
MTSSILIIYTGGTIGMKEDPMDGTLKPFDFSQIMEEVPELNKFDVKINSYTFSPLIDSSDVEPSLWISLAEIIRDNYEEYDGFVILHGTDTMAYSASTLSFMLEGLTKPVVFTGSQLPIGVPRTDGKENLISAVEIAAAKDHEGHARVPEVCIYFDSRLLRGNRSTKYSAEAFNAFASPNCPPLAEAGIQIRYHTDLIRKPIYWDAQLRVQTHLDTRVSILKVHPGMTPQVMRSVVSDPLTRACIIETYGSGNALSKDWFLNILREACDAGKILLNVTQCKSGTVNMDLYATGATLKHAGVLSGSDITTEAALGKLFSLLGRSDKNAWVKSMLEKNLCGEITK